VLPTLDRKAVVAVDAATDATDVDVTVVTAVVIVVVVEGGGGGGVAAAAARAVRATRRDDVPSPLTAWLAKSVGSMKRGVTVSRRWFTSMEKVSFGSYPTASGSTGSFLSFNLNNTWQVGRLVGWRETQKNEAQISHSSENEPSE
jgi:hypothetical protein